MIKTIFHNIENYEFNRPHGYVNQKKIINASVQHIRCNIEIEGLMFKWTTVCGSNDVLG